jgi:MscS family membrane protein
LKTGMLDGLDILAVADGWTRLFSYEVVTGNALWRFLVVLVVVALTLLVGRVVQRSLLFYAESVVKRKGENHATVAIRCLANPAYVAIFAIGMFCAKLPLVLSIEISEIWTSVSQTIGVVALTYAFYRLVDVVEFGLLRLASKTETRFDDMLVPVIEKTLKVVIIIVAVLLICEHLLGQDKVKSLLLVAVVCGIPVALAAKETIADFFGSMAISADRPFDMGHLVKINDYEGEVDDVGFRCTRLRTLDGHVITIPNRTVAESIVENIGARPYIRRVASITIACENGHEKAARAVEVIKEILSPIHELNAVPDQPPRVYFSDFSNGALSLSLSYVVKPADPWFFQEVNERVNLEIMKRFEKERIAFAYPTQTVYLKKES